MDSMLIIGADEFFGLSLCERMMDEGNDVDVILASPDNENRRIYLEERLMWLGRNEHFRQLKNIGDKQYDKVCVQYGSGDFSADSFKNETVYILVYEHDREKWEKEVKNDAVSCIILPRMYGQWKEEQEEKTENSFFVDDVADQLRNYLVSGTEKDRSKVIHLQVEEQTPEEEAKTKIIEWKRQFSSLFDKY
ncbi:hypothetical protein MOE20_13795 [Bacillus atrophaeus]|uniref:hypothetical protein n=1 Tax=Bacillus atrophaeus TaxID=1452 RepID=UPI002281924E|nr:hypothetical protein [Bacillus atrophaeus]MCY8916702.1 hypothetical protein [Bacillus atrophaeus]MCY8925673.1 hypothetical protein [Bacillus atrophaeus]MCY9108623.1 hypothetical protein [Bacillus atrophaeus]